MRQRGAAAGTPRAILFDLDGVLVETREVWRQLLNDALDWRGRPPLAPERFQQVWGQSVEDDCRLFLPELRPAELAEFYARQFASRARAVRVLDGAREALRGCRARGLGRACVTNSPPGVALAMLRSGGLEGELDEVVTPADVKRPKPAPDMVLEALHRLGVGPTEAWLIGDTAFDREAGRAAGVHVILVGSGEAEPAGGSRRIRSLAELEGLLDAPEARG